MYLDNCIKELELNGVVAERVTVNKNGAPFEGLRLGGNDAGIHPVIYPTRENSLDDIVSLAKTAMASIPDEASWKVLSDWEYVRKNMRVAVQKHSTDDVYKKDYLNLELIMRVHLDFEGTSASTKVGSSLAKMLGVSETDLWKTALDNCSSSYQIRSLSEAIGISTDAECPLYVVTSPNTNDGAGALAFPHVFRDFCKEHAEQSCYILPSSTEEVLVIPGSSALTDPQDLANMVSTINREIVDPTIQLPAVVYEYRLDTDRIEIVAEA